jgi:hypothetical protein
MHASAYPRTLACAYRDKKGGKTEREEGRRESQKEIWSEGDGGRQKVST